MEVLINHILYIRNVYPAQIFRKCLAYNTAVYISIYKPLNSYISGVLRAARALLANDELKCLELEMYDKDDSDIIYEQYKIDTQLFPPLPIENNVQQRDLYLMDFEEELRNCLCKSAERLNTLSSKLPNSARFRINLHTTETAYMQLNHESRQQDFIWLKNDQTIVNKYRNKKGSIALLPLARVKHIGLNLSADIFKKQDLPSCL